MHLDYPDVGTCIPAGAACCERPAGLVAPVPVDPTGANGPTQRQAAGPRLRQTSRGLYVPSDVDATVVEQRIFEQAHRIKSAGAVTGWAALRWRGARYFDGTDWVRRELLPVPLVVGPATAAGRTTRVEISQAQIAPTEYARVDGGIWCATVQRALFDEMRFAVGVRAAVVAMDMAAAARLISVCADVPIRRSSGRPGPASPLVREALALAIERQPFTARDADAAGLGARRGAADARCATSRSSTLDGRLLGIPRPVRSGAGWWGSTTARTTRTVEQHRRDVEREQLLP